MRDDFLEALALSIEAHGLLEKGERVLVALSGGPDSLALLHGLRRLGYQVGAAHLDHGLRQESGQEARWVAAHCENLGLPCWVGRASGLEASASEAACRDARYAFLNTVARQEGFRAIALAHHLDDQAETLIFRLARGTGTSGLTGMRPERRQTDGPTLIRPLLALSRAQIESALGAWGLQALQDPSNDDPRFSRNRIRQAVMPELKAINRDAARHMARLAERIQDEEISRQEETEGLAKYMTRDLAPGLGEVSRRALLGLSPERQRMLLRCFARRLGAPLWDAEALKSVLVTALHGGKTSLPGGWMATVRDDWLALDGAFPGISARPFATAGQQPTGPWGWEIKVEKVLGAEAPTPLRVKFASSLPAGLNWRSADPSGDRFSPWGSDRPHSLGYFLSRAGIASHRQRTLLVLAAGTEVLWVVGVRRGTGHALSSGQTQGYEMQARASFWV